MASRFFFLNCGKRIWQAYSGVLDRRPILTKAFTTMTLYGTADLFSQQIEFFVVDRQNLKLNKQGKKTKEIETEHHYNWIRTLRMATFGFCVTGPAFHYWYKFLDTKFPTNAFRHVLYKAGIDQVFCAPVFNLGFFFGMGLLEGKKPSQINETLKSEFIAGYAVDCLIWPAANLISFRYISNRQRVLFMNCVNLIFAAMLSLIKNRDSSPLAEHPHLLEDALENTHLVDPFVVHDANATGNTITGKVEQS